MSPLERMHDSRLDAIDARITGWMARHGLTLLRVSLGLVFLWFGALKFLAAWECLIGLGLLTKQFLRATLLLLGAQMAGTLSPLLLFPADTFSRFPYAPTLEGQYILKNAVIISAAIVLGATVRGGGIVPRPSPDLPDANGELR